MANREFDVYDALHALNIMCDSSPTYTFHNENGSITLTPNEAINLMRMFMVDGVLVSTRAVTVNDRGAALVAWNTAYPELSGVIDLSTGQHVKAYRSAQRNGTD